MALTATDGQLPTPAHVLVPVPLLHLLSAVLQSAFRSHCTGEDVGDRRPWRLVGAVQKKLLELSREHALPVPEERLLAFIEDLLTAESLRAQQDGLPVGSA